MFNLKDGIYSFVLTKVDDNTFRNAGFADAGIDNTTSSDWDDTSETTGKVVTISGLVYATP
jgi:hypothetical protein